MKDDQKCHKIYIKEGVFVNIPFNLTEEEKIHLIKMIKVLF